MCEYYQYYAVQFFKREHINVFYSIFMTLLRVWNKMIKSVLIQNLSLTESDLVRR